MLNDAAVLVLLRLLPVGALGAWQAELAEWPQLAMSAHRVAQITISAGALPRELLKLAMLLVRPRATESDARTRVALGSSATSSSTSSMR